MPTVDRQVALWLVAYAFLVVMLGTTLPTPLYPIYQRQFGFSQLTITIIFAVYGGVVIAGLLLLGRLSDIIGRRWMLLPGIALSAASAMVFITDAGLPTMLAGRVLSGFSAAIFTGTATAAMVDLAGPQQRLKATTIAVAVNLGGLGTGQVLSGLLSQFAPLPLQLSFAVDILLTIPAAVAILLIPETVGDRRWQWRPQRIIVPAAVRPVFIPAAIAGLSGFAVFGVFSSVVPSFISRVLHLSNHALVGAILFLLLIFSVLGQIAVNRLNVRVALPLGCAGLMLGTGLVGLAVLLSQLWPLITATVVLGSGQGLVVGSGLGGINQKAPEKQRGEVASTYFTALYFGLTLPVVATGFASDSLGLRPAGLLMTSSTIVVVGAVLAWLLLRPVATD